MSNPYVHVRIAYGGTTGTQTTCDVYRSTVGASGPWDFLETIPLLAQTAHYYDTGAPLGVDFWYRAVGHPGTEATQTLIAGPIQLEQPPSVWVKDPLRPWADLEMDFCGTGPQAHDACGTPSPELVWVGLGEITRDDDVTLLPITGSETPATVFARRKNHEGSFQFLTRTLAAKEKAYDLLTYGGPLLLQLPPVYGQGDIYVQPGQVKEARLGDDQRRPYRLWTVPYTVVAAPVGPKQGTACANWCAVKAAYPTFGDMVAAGGTWDDVASEQLLCGSPDDQGGYGDGLYGDGPYGE
ncbi:hypothetical protein [Streptomyces hebeiensis]